MSLKCGKNLGSRNRETEYPIRSLHDFLLDVENELKKSRRVSALGAVASILILSVLGRFIFVLLNISGNIPNMPPKYPGGLMLLFDLVLIILASACLFYSFQALMGQNAFLRRWGERFEEVRALEHKLLEERDEKR
jgi:hypothetical protein